MIYATFVPLIALLGMLMFPCPEWSIGVHFVLIIICQAIAEYKYQSLLDRVKELERKALRISAKPVTKTERKIGSDT